MCSARVSPEHQKVDGTPAEKSKVAVLKTAPETVLDDYGRLMRMADYEKCLPKDKDTALKINISRGVFYPACSTTPWQLDGVIKTMLAILADGWSSRFPSRTVPFLRPEK